MKGITSVLLLALFLSTVVALSGCETFKGTGRDISNFGNLISGDGEQE